MKNRNWYWGVFFVLAAATVVANQLGYLGGIGWLSLTITLLLVLVIIVSIVRLNFFGILFPLALICIIYADKFVYADRLILKELTPWPVLIAAAFGSLGLSLIFRRNKTRGFMGGHTEHYAPGGRSRENEKHCKKTNEYEKIEDSSDDIVEARTSFGESSQYIKSQSFKKGTFHTSFGAMKIFFDGAALSPEGAEADFHTAFGGVEVYIPKEWNVRCNISAVLGGVDEKNKYRHTEDGPELLLTGNVSFGGIDIIYV